MSHTPNNHIYTPANHTPDHSNHDHSLLRHASTDGTAAFTGAHYSDGVMVDLQDGRTEIDGGFADAADAIHVLNDHLQDEHPGWPLLPETLPEPPRN